MQWFSDVDEKHIMQAGRSEVFLHHLPGFPDGISRGANNTLWVACFPPLGPLELRMMRPRAVRWLLAVLPALRPKLKLGAIIVQVGCLSGLLALGVAGADRPSILMFLYLPESIPLQQACVFFVISGPFLLVFPRRWFDDP